MARIQNPGWPLLRGWIHGCFVVKEIAPAHGRIRDDELFNVNWRVIMKTTHKGVFLKVVVVGAMVFICIGASVSLRSTMTTTNEASFAMKGR